MKSILILSPDRPDNPMGGLGVHVSEILSRFNTSIFNVTAVCLGQTTDKVLENGVHIYGVNPEFSITSTKDSLVKTFLIQSRISAVVMSLISQRKIRKPDLVHIMDWSTAIAGIDIARCTGAKPVFAVHLSIANYIKNISKLQESNWEEAKQIEFLACQKAFRVLQVSRPYCNLFPFNFFKHKETVIPNGVDIDEYANNDKLVMLPGKNKYKILYAGRIADMKNVATLMNIDLPKDCDLVFMGGRQGSSDMLIAKLNEVCENCNDKFYIGAKYGAEKVAYMKAADLIIVPSVHEPFGMVALEGLACGCNGKTLVASSFVDGLGDFLTDEAALRCGVTAESIRQCLLRFIKMGPEERSKIAENAFNLAKQYGWENTVCKIEQVYKEVLNIKI